MKKKYSLEEIKTLEIPIKKGNIIFLHWDLAAWKTTLTKHIINNILGINAEVKSPTYTYFNKYKESIYHFDLYRLESYDEFVMTWCEEILDNENNTCIIEWSDVIKQHFKPDLEIFLEKTQDDNIRNIEIKVVN